MKIKIYSDSLKRSTLVLMLVFASRVLFAQAANNYSDQYNSGSVYDFGVTTAVTTAASSVGYRATAGGFFQHSGSYTTSPASAIGTLTVNGSYDVQNGVDDFVGPLGNGFSAGVVSSPQQIAGNTTPNFYTLLIRNGSAQFDITNTMGVNIRNNVQFSNGITTTVRSNINTGALRFLNNATYTGSVNNVLTASGADAQHVNGYVGKIGNQSFIFPVGSGTDARPLQISAPASATDEYDVAWMAGNPSTNADPSDPIATQLHPGSTAAYPLLNVSVAGQWDWIPVSGTGAGLTITVSIPDMSTFALATNLRLAGWNGTQWIDLSNGASTASGNTENNTLSGTMQAGITAIGIGSVTNILDLTITSFNATKQNNSALLNWSAPGANISSFVIERNTNGDGYVNIGEVDAGNNNIITSDYNFTDNAPANGSDSYRLKMIDENGAVSYSEIRNLNFTGAGTISIYPNPATDNIIVSGIETGMQLKLISGNGTIVSTQIATGNTEKISVQSLSTGIYVIETIQNGMVLNVARFMKK